MLADQHIVQHRQFAEEADILEGPRYAVGGDDVGLSSGNGFPVQQDLARSGYVQAAQHVQDGGLARTVGSDQRLDLAAVGLPCPRRPPPSTRRSAWPAH